MFALLSPRLWLAIGIAAALAFSHFTAYRSGKANVRLEWQAATAAANTEGRRMEQARQSRADEAARSATTRQAGLLADAASAGDALGRLRNAIAARRLAEESAAAATQRADTYGKLFLESAEAYRELAATCDRHASDVTLLLEAWPR